MVRATELYRHTGLWQEAMQRAMLIDWSWERTALRYDELYRRAQASRSARRPRSSYGADN
jgi:starch synthase